jgi:hypothetical protein
MLRISRTNSSNPDFVALVKKLDAYLTITDGDEHAFYEPFNKIASINHVVVFHEKCLTVACGAVKQMGPTRMSEKLCECF